MKRIICLGISLFFITMVFLPVKTTATSIQNSDTNECYGYVISVTPDQPYSLQNNISELINKLLEVNATVYWLCSDKTIQSSNLIDKDIQFECSFSKGSFIVTFDDNSSKNVITTALIYDYYLNKNIEAHRVIQPLLDINVYQLCKPKIVYHV